MMNYIPHARYFIVKNQSIAGRLMVKGFVLEKLDKNRDGSGRNVFLFSNSENLVDTINEILQQQ